MTLAQGLGPQYFRASAVKSIFFGFNLQATTDWMQPPESRTLLVAS
jgi:hypothetical protein